MARLDFSDCSPLRPAAEPVGRQAASTNSGALSLPDRVPWDCPGAREIGFTIAERYNASAVLFDNLVAGRGDRPAVIGPAGARSYAQLAADAARWGNAFLALGLSRGDRILMVLDDTPIYPAAFFGAVRAGFVPILINVLTPPDLLRFYLEDSGAETAVVEAEFCSRFASACGGRTPLKTLVVVNGEPSVALGGVDIEKANEWLASFADRLDCADTHRNDMAFWMYSSGSTGRPKGIVHLQHDMTYTHQSYGRAVLKLTPHDICFSVPKIFFSYGFGNSITFPFSVGAASLLMSGRATPAAVFAAVAQYRPTVFYGLPTLYTLLTHAPEIRDADFSSLRLAVSAAEILSTEIFNAWKAATGLEIIECLGSTEMLNVYLSNTPERRKAGAAGMRVPGYEIVLKDEAGNEVADGCEGMMWIRGHSGAPMFWNRPERTAQTIREGGWLCTGDRLIRDRDGFYFFRGRKDDLVKVSGQWVNPIEVQRCLLDHPDVRECVVLPVELPDKRMALKAFVVPTAPVYDRKAATCALQDHVKRKLVPYKYPRLVAFLPELPKTGTGKVDRQALLSGAAALKHVGAAAGWRSARPPVEPRRRARPPARRCVMKTLRAKNLQLAGIELVLPTVLCIDGRQSKGARTTLTVGYAAGYVDTIVTPLVAEWLLRYFHWRFTEHGRGAEGDLAAEAFYDKLASDFGRVTPFLAAIVSQPHSDRHCHGNGNVLSRFMSGGGLVRWTCAGPVRAFINPKTGAAQVAFEPLPGGIELTSADKLDFHSTKLSRRTNEAAAWCGFGVPISDPADIVLMLCDEISASRHAHAHARRAAHV